LTDNAIGRAVFLTIINTCDQLYLIEP